LGGKQKPPVVFLLKKTGWKDWEERFDLGEKEETPKEPPLFTFSVFLFYIGGLARYWGLENQPNYPGGV